MATLEEEEIVSIEKGRLNRKPRTWVRLTPAGRQAFHADAIMDRVVHNTIWV